MTSSMPKLNSDMFGNSFLQDGRPRMSSSVNADWNCSSKALAIAQLDDEGKPLLDLRRAMPVSSLHKALIYN